MKQVQKRWNNCRLSLSGGIPTDMELTSEYRLVGSGAGISSYLAQVFDSRDLKGTYHRFQLIGQFKDCKYEVVAAATDVDISEQLLAQGITSQEQLELLCRLKHVRQVNQKDFLLHELEGRYLWILIRVMSVNIEAEFELQGFQVDFPKSSFVEYLPEVYQTQQDTFFYRYMAALQSLYVDLEEQVDGIPALLDYEITESQYLKELAEWAGLEGLKEISSATQLRYLLGRLSSLQTGKGTGEILKEVLELLTLCPVRVVEFFKWRDWMGEGNPELPLFSRLYGTQENTFSVIILGDSGQESVVEPLDLDALMELIQEYTPMGLTCNLVYLTESYHMDTHCYLDINSYLSTPRTADTAGFVLGGNYVLG